MGTAKVMANRSLVRKVAIVDPQISLLVWVFSDSSDIWIPRASENASAMAMVRIPPSTTRLEWVPEWRSTMRPRVVITAEVSPKEMPVGPRPGRLPLPDIWRSCSQHSDKAHHLLDHGNITKPLCLFHLFREE